MLERSPGLERILDTLCSNCCKMFNHFCNTVVVSQSVSACKSLSLVTWSLSLVLYKYSMCDSNQKDIRVSD